MMISSKQLVVIMMVFVSWTISNQIRDSFKNTKAISRLKDMKIIREAKLQPADSKVSKEVTGTVLKMSKLTRKVVLKKPDKNCKVPQDIISVPMTVMSSGIRTIVRVLKKLVTVDREGKSNQVPGGPLCMQLCLRRGSLHPAQCHELC